MLKKDKSSGWICPKGDNSHFIDNNFAGIHFRHRQIVAKFKSREKKVTAKIREIVCLGLQAIFYFIDLTTPLRTELIRIRC